MVFFSLIILIRLEAVEIANAHLLYSRKIVEYCCCCKLLNNMNTDDTVQSVMYS